MNVAAFDDLAADYDASFTHSPVGSALRALVWSRFSRVFAGSRRILELGCGTGEDAIRLASFGARVVALDPSADMIKVARQKALQANCADRIEFHCVPAELMSEVLGSQRFDGVMSNFGALNCVADLSAVIGEAAARLEPGARLCWVMLGRYVPWEWAWFLLQGDSRRAGRRLRGATSWRGLTIAYPTPEHLRALLHPSFRVDEIRPLGVVLPPSYAAQWLTRRPGLLRALARAEGAFQGFASLANCADHYIVEATRLPATQAD